MTIWTVIRWLLTVPMRPPIWTLISRWYPPEWTGLFFFYVRILGYAKRRERLWWYSRAWRRRWVREACKARGFIPSNELRAMREKAAMTTKPPDGGEVMEHDAYFMCSSCDQATLPEERQVHRATDLRLVDGEPWCESCYDCSGIWQDKPWREREQFDPFSNARAEERKAIAARLREPDEAMVEVVARRMASAVQDDPMTWPDFKLLSRGVITALADALDPSPPPAGEQ